MAGTKRIDHRLHEMCSAGCKRLGNRFSESCKDFKRSEVYSDGLCEKCSIGKECALSNELETELAKYCQIMDERRFGLRRRDIRVLAYQVAVKNNIQHPFSGCKGMSKING
jgi:hypothetical protein